MTIQSHLVELRRKHETLAEMVEKAQRAPGVDDLKIAELLTRAMEQSMTRNTGGGEFIERRDYPPEIEKAMDKLNFLRKNQKSI